MKRRSFLIRIGGAIAATPVALQLAGCPSDDDTDPPPPPADANNGDVDSRPAGNCTMNGAEASNISFNHGHFLDNGDIPADDINNPMQRTYTLQGSSGHPHSITLEPMHFDMLAAGMTVTVTSTVDAGHPHDVTLVCL